MCSDRVRCGLSTAPSILTWLESGIDKPEILIETWLGNNWARWVVANRPELDYLDSKLAQNCQFYWHRTRFAVMTSKIREWILEHAHYLRWEPRTVVCHQHIGVVVYCGLQWCGRSERCKWWIKVAQGQASGSVQAMPRHSRGHPWRHGGGW